MFKKFNIIEDSPSFLVIEGVSSFKMKNTCSGIKLKYIKDLL